MPWGDEKMIMKKKYMCIILAFLLFAGINAGALSFAQADTATVPSIPEVSVTSADADSLTVSWKCGSGDAEQYEVSWEKHSGVRSRGTETVSSTETTLTGLTAATRYYVSVRAVNSNGASAWSNAAAATTAKLSRKQLLGNVRKAPGGNSIKSFNTNYKVADTGSGRALASYTKKLKADYKITYVMIDLSTGEGITCGSKNRMYSASCLKGPYVAALNKYRAGSVKKHKGLERQTIIMSNNITYAKLHSMYGSSPMKNMKKYSEVTSFASRSKYAYLPTRDLGKLWIGTYWYFYRNKNSNSDYCRSLYTHGYNSFIYKAMKGKKKVHAKPGWYPGCGYNVQNDAGIIMAKVDGSSRPYMIAVMTSACGRYSSLKTLVRKIDAVHTDMISEN